MKHLIFTIALFVYNSICLAQIIVNPTFSRSDTPNFHVDIIRITTDTTFITCSYLADKGSWANISPNTYIVDNITKHKTRILKSDGIPFSPERINFSTSTIQKIVLYFSSIKAKEISLIEDESNNAFNVYNISLTDKYDSTYTYEEYNQFYSFSKERETSNDFIGAIEYKKKQLDAAKYLYGYNSIFCGSIMYDLNLLYVKTNELTKAIEWGEKSIGIIKNLPGNFDEDIARIYSSLMANYASMGKFNIALEYGEKSLALRKIVWGETNPELGSFLLYMARIYNYTGDFPKALLYTKDAACIFKTVYGEISAEYLHSLINLTTFYNSTGNYNEVLKVGKDAVEIADNEKLNNEPFLKAGAYNNYSLALSSVGNNDEAIEYAKKAIQILNDIGQGKSHQAVTILSNIGANYIEKKDTLHALAYIEQALELDKQISEENTLERAHLMEYLAGLYYKTDISKCIDYYRQSVQIMELLFKDDNMQYAKTVSKLAITMLMRKVFYNQGDADSIACHLNKASNIIESHTKKSMFSLLRNERSSYWKEYVHLYDNWIPVACYLLQTDSLNALAYNAMLFSKGFQLGVENRIKNFLANNTDTNISDLYGEYMNLLDEQIKKRNTEQTESDSINALIKEKEMILLKVLPDQEIYNVSWQNVKSFLKNNDIAIEFGSCELLNDSTMYFALVINKNLSSPRCIPLFEEKEVLKLTKSPSYPNDINLTKKIWGPLIDYINDADNVYFSASGILNLIGIEYLPIYGKEGMIKSQPNMYRLSSTNEICLQHEFKSWKNAILFGDLDFDNDNSDVDVIANNSISQTLSRSFIDSLSTRGSFEPLINTSNEVSQINEILSSHNVATQILSKSNGTEQLFKALPNEDFNILHLATHGMYVEENELEIKKERMNLRFMLIDDDDILEEDRLLTHSFLVLAGGNALLKRDSLQQKPEDGILTGLEISRMSFKNLDLVVLSACQTALGVVSSEGVYGLQRAFKKAGANTILMSLDRVDDEATMILMTEFYKNLMSGKKKLQSLKDAQTYLCEVDNGKYNKPEYWASFILLDGLN